EEAQRRDCLLVADRLVRDPPRVTEVAVLGADAGVVEARRDRVRLRDLSGLALENVALAALEHPDLAGGERGAVLPGLDPTPGRLDADHPHAAVVEERVEEPHRVAAAADARDQVVGQAAERAARLAAGLV